MKSNVLTADTARAFVDAYRVPTVDELRHHRLSGMSEEKRATADVEAIGRRWAPVPHADLLGGIETEAERLGLPLDRDKLTLEATDGGHTINGEYPLIVPVQTTDRVQVRIDPVYDDGRERSKEDVDAFLREIERRAGSAAGFAPTIRFRSSNVQRFALCLISAGRVLICWNGLVVTIETVVVSMLHTVHADAGVSLREGMKAWFGQQVDGLRQIDRMQGASLPSPAQTDHLLLSAVREGVVPASKAIKVDAEHRSERNAEQHGRDRSLWTLYQAGTETAKEWPRSARERFESEFPGFGLRHLDVPRVN